MARTTLSKTTLLGPFPTLPISANAADLVETAADVSNKNQFVMGGRDIVIAHNTGGSAYVVTLTSAATPENRTGDISAYSIGAGEIAIFGPFGERGWMQADKYFYLEADNAAVKFAIVTVP